jgi:hypothetical protein
LVEEISEAKVSLIEPLVIPDFFLKPNELKPEFSFLGTVKGYAQYYQDLERSQGSHEKYYNPVDIQGFGSLSPLRIKHSRNSYWRYFRLPIEKAKWEGNLETVQDLFLLLPLVVNIPVKPLKVNKQVYSAKAYAHIFPFGSCVVNMDFKFSKISLIDFISLIPNLKRSSIEWASSEGTTFMSGSFKKFSQEVTTQITHSLFGDDRIVVPFDLHAMLFIRKMMPPNVLQILSNRHKRAIAAAMTDQSYENVLSLRNVDNCISTELQKLRTREILLFHPKGSFFYASPDWQKPITKTTPRESAKLRLKAECMRSNYQSFLNVLFAVNRFLKTCTIDKHAQAPPQRIKTVKNSFMLAFLTDTSNMYYKHAYDKVAPVIGLDKSLQGVKLWSSI